MLKPREPFGRYVIEALLGEGGMGSVYRAFDPKLHRRVAIKIVRGSGAPVDTDDTVSGETMARLLREARAAAALEHPNAVAVYDVGDVDGVAYIVMELVPGQTLRSALGDVAVGWPLRLRWLVDVARALAAAHERGLVHRDVKPENVMVRTDGVVKVLDFGIARRLAVAADPSTPTLDTADALLAEEGGAATLTRQGTTVGTPLYMAPEQLRGEKADGRSDQFSWAVMAYEVLTGHPPWRLGVSRMELAASIMRDEPAPMRAKNADLPAEVEACVMRCLRKSPSDRFASMGEVVRVLKQQAQALANATDVGVASDQDPRTYTPIPSTSKRAGRRSSVLVALTVLVAAAAASALLVARPLRWRGHATSSASGQTASASAASGAENVVLTTNPEALSAYEAAMASYRAATGKANVNVQRAIELDPDFTAARLFLITIYGCGPGMREHYPIALAHRDRLPEQLRALLDAYEPYCQREPPDKAERNKRLRALATRYPNDAFIGYRAAFAFADPLPELDRVLAIDPGFAYAYVERGQLLIRRDDLGGGLAAYAKCLEISPAAVYCQNFLTTAVAVSGDCARYEREARRAINMKTEARYFYARLAEALLAQGHSVAAAREALRGGEEIGAKRTELYLRAASITIDIFAGDFSEALRGIGEAERSAAKSTAEWDHAWPVLLRLLVLHEMGNREGAREAAQDFLARRGGWDPETSSWLDPTTWGFVDITPQLLGVLTNLGAMDRAERVRRRDEGIARSRARIVHLSEEDQSDWRRRYEWLLMVAPAVESREDALEALTLLVELPSSVWSTVSYEPIGRTFLLAGRVDEALPWLERSAHACNPMNDATLAMRARFELAEAREQKGDKDAACAEYAVVLSRWGNAKPRSLTAEKARARSRALACPP